MFQIMKFLRFPSLYSLYRISDFTMFYMLLYVLLFTMGLHNHIWGYSSLWVYQAIYRSGPVFIGVYVFYAVMYVYVYLMQKKNTIKLSSNGTAVLESKFYLDGWTVKCNKIVSIHISRLNLPRNHRMTEKEKERYLVKSFFTLVREVRLRVENDPRFEDVKYIRGISTKIKEGWIKRLGYFSVKENSFSTCLNVVTGPVLISNGWRILKSFKEISRDVGKVRKFEIPVDIFLSLNLSLEDRLLARASGGSTEYGNNAG